MHGYGNLSQLGVGYYCGLMKDGKLGPKGVMSCKDESQIRDFFLKGDFTAPNQTCRGSLVEAYIRMDDMITYTSIFHFYEHVPVIKDLEGYLTTEHYNLVI